MAPRKRSQAELRPRIGGSTAGEITASLEEAVQDGRLAPGEVLPSVRELAAALGVSPATVAASYRALRDRGVITTQKRSRSRVSTRPPLSVRPVIPVPDDVRDLASGNPDPALLPNLGRALRRIEVEQRLYGGPSTLPEVTGIVLQRFAEEGAPEGNVAVVSGALDGIERALGAYLRPGDRVAVEDPCYTGVLDLVRAAGFAPVPIELDADGPVAESLVTALRTEIAACVLTPRGQNPTGAALTLARAQALQDVLADWPRVLVVEDDHLGPVSGTPRFTVLANRSRWAIVSSMAKSFGPDLRIAFLLGDPQTVSRVEGRQLLGPGWVSYVLQTLAIDLLTDREVAELIRTATRTYRVRREALIEALGDRGIEGRGKSGFNVWIPVREEEQLLRGLLHLGWAVKGGESYRLRSPPAIRVTTATLGQADAEEFADAVAATLTPQRRTHFP